MIFYSIPIIHESRMSKLETRLLIRMFVEEENREKRAQFNALGLGKGHHTADHKDYAIEKAKSIGVRATSRLLHVPRRTIQRWLRSEGVTVKRCPDWVYDWAYWRRRSIEKRRFWR